MSTRSLYLLALITIGFLLLTSLYLQFFVGILPCPLCTLQRIAFGTLGILFLIGIIADSKRWACLLVNFLSALVSALGIVLAGRQLWLQHFPTTEGECGVSIQYMLQVLPFNEVVEKIFAGSAECSQSTWEFMHLNMPAWALLWFILFFFLSLYLVWKDRK